MINHPSIINSIPYWKLNPDQATSDPKKSPDPLAVLKPTVEDDSNLANEKTDAEKYSNGQLVGDERGAVGGKDKEKMRWNDSMV